MARSDFTEAISPALCLEWQGPSDATAFDYLHSRGFTCFADGWTVPAGFALTNRDKRAILFLHDAWDYPVRVFEEAPRVLH